MTLRKQFVEDKITIANEYLLKARAIFDAMTTEEILHSELNLHTMERYLQLIVDAVLDINNHFIKELSLEPAKDLKGTFQILAVNNILEKEFAQKISEVVGLRNIIAHQYEKVDVKKFLEDFRKHSGDFDQYFKYILTYLDGRDF
ncbi:hypothetical protein A3A03_01780 [Candidatus Nomurabacteria bacterium RIFCSPLOWO2_01_FULL_40_18]|uniref:DUF86 domain-containing protein n=1 Tax=Candidatus Nomurabacteria bacterium RIFCSPLOWO2_01_FULL_40_18 TaxID=1801773 RepID=A0A1F6XM12_9BACT|nr:MAG: hypothetical protein A3A03_01780 [Candidatus Nomurabacteria bacterium RIFCSPLOWO2_01_FULL_40_18]